MARNVWKPTEEEKKIIISERQRLAASGLPGEEVLKRTTGKARQTLLADYYRRQETGEEPKEKPVEIETVQPDFIGTDIDQLVREYEENATEEHRKALYKPHSQAFTGLINYISHRLDKQAIRNSLESLYQAWEDYKTIVYSHNQNPMIMEFCMFIGIHRDTFNSWARGETRNEYSSKLTLTRTDLIKNITNECVMGHAKSAEGGSVGSIFTLKAQYGWVETAPQAVINPIQAQNNAEIAAKMGLLLSDNSTTNTED